MHVTVWQAAALNMLHAFQTLQILICQNLRNNLQHPNEYIRAVTLRCAGHPCEGKDCRTACCTTNSLRKC